MVKNDPFADEVASQNLTKAKNRQENLSIAQQDPRVKGLSRVELKETYLQNFVI